MRKIEILKYVQKQAKVENDTFMDREPKEFEFAFSHGIKIDQPVPNPNKKSENGTMYSLSSRPKEFKKPAEEVQKAITRISF